MKKRIAAIVLCVFCLLAIAGCSQSKPDAQTAQPTAAQETGDYLTTISGTYEELFPQLAKAEYRDLWIDATTPLVGAENAETATDTLLAMCMAEPYGPEASEKYAERARRWVERNAPAFRVDFSALQQNLLGDKWYRCSPAGPRCEHVFRELYESAAYLDPAFLRLKVLELLMLLGSIPRGAGTDAYCSARQAELIRHIRDHLLTDREGYTSLSRLAAEHEMSVSHLQKLFKQIYGVPVYHYIKEYRLEQAAVELVRSARPVTEIAQDAGYDNASKFSACFKERYGVTPSQYRTDAKAKQSIGTKTE